jgi:hypothetical protein
VKLGVIPRLEVPSPLNQHPYSSWKDPLGISFQEHFGGEAQHIKGIGLVKWFKEVEHLPSKWEALSSKTSNV